MTAGSGSEPEKGLASWRDGKLTHYPEIDGQRVFSLLEDREGTIWAAGSTTATEGRLCAIRGGHGECYGNGGSLGTYLLSLYEDRSGGLWLGTEKGVWRWRPGPLEFFPIPDFVLGLAEGDGGELLISTLGGMKRLFNERTEPYALRGVSQKFNKLLRRSRRRSVGREYRRRCIARAAGKNRPVFTLRRAFGRQRQSSLSGSRRQYLGRHHRWAGSIP